MIKLKENKGVLLISTFVLAAVLSVLSGAYITSSIVQNQSVQRQKDSLQSFYAAEKGIEYAFVESQNSNWGWTTHVAETDTNNDGDADPNELLPKQAGIPMPTLDGEIVRIINNTDPLCPSCYEITIPSGQIVQVKAYFDPLRPDETVVLSRNITASASRILRYRITRRSLYRYFYYYPTDKTFSYITFDGKDADGNPAGGIYVKGNIGLGWKAVFNNIAELSTNKNGSIFLNSYKYTAPNQLDNKLGGIDGKAPLPQVISPYTYANNNGPPNIYSNENQYPYSPNGNWPPYAFPPKDWYTINSHFDGTDNLASAAAYNPKVNGITLPRRLSATWTWDKYGVEPPVSAQDVKFYDATTGNEATQAYWDNVKAILSGMGTMNGNSSDPAFWTDWSDKTYKWSPSSSAVNFLNTAQQADDWNAWLDSTGTNLKGVVQEKNSGGYDTVIPNIQASYSTLAKENGLYIGQDASGQTEVYLNGQNIGASLPNWIADNKQFYNTVKPQDRDSDGVMDKENVLELDISQSLNSAQIPDNGIIYIASKNLRLVNASTLPANLTIVSPYNIYIKGNYNTQDWKPSAVITNSLVYFLSNSFSDPQNLPATINPRENPVEVNYITRSYFNPVSPNYNLTNLTDEIKRFFGLTNFTITAAPGDYVGLVNNIRSQYNLEYGAAKPNVATSSTFNVAVASPYEPTSNQLERWTGSNTPTIQGAFLQLPSSWANDDNGNPIRDVPANYYGKRTGGPNDFPLNNPRRDPNPMDNWPALIIAKNPDLKYEYRFVNPQQRPSGDFFAASEPLWEETLDFDHNT